MPALVTIHDAGPTAKGHALAALAAARRVNSAVATGAPMSKLAEALTEARELSVLATLAGNAIVARMAALGAGGAT